MRNRDLSSPALLKARYESGKAEHLVSAPGIGKSSVVRNYPALLSAMYGEAFGYHEEIVTTIEGPDVRGFLVPSKDKDGNANSYFTRPGILPSREYLTQHPRGIYFIDERSQANLDVQKALAPVVLERKFGSYNLPEGWWVISASNRMEDKSGVVKPPMHLINRERTIEVEFDITSFAVWAETNDVHPLGIAFAKAKPGIFAKAVPSKTQPFCTPRSLVTAMQFLTEVVGRDEHGNPSMDIPIENYVVQELMAGDIGEGAAAEFFSFSKCKDQLPTYQEIINNPTGCKCPEALDAAYAAVQLCIHYAKGDNIDKLWTFVERLPVELQTSAATSLVENTKAGGTVLLNSKALSQWMANNKALIVNTNAN